MQKFSGQVNQVSDDQPVHSGKGTTRRRLIKGAAWAAPAILMAKAAPNAAASTTWSAATNNRAVSLDTTLLGLNLTSIGIANNANSLGPALSHNSDAKASNLFASALNNLVTVTPASVHAYEPNGLPSDTSTDLGGITLKLLPGPGGSTLLSTGVIPAEATAEWGGDTAAGSDRSYATSSVNSLTISGLANLGISGTDVADIGLISSSGTSELVSVGSVHTVQATSSGSIGTVSILGGAVTIGVVSDPDTGGPQLTATADGINAGILNYIPPKTVTVNGTVLPPGASVTVNSINVGTLDTATVQVDSADAATSTEPVGSLSADGTAVVLTITVTISVLLSSLQLSKTTIRLLPLSATAIPGGTM